MLDATAWPRVRRLFRWLEQFHDCFHHQAQRLALRRYIHGVLGDSARKSMEAMLARVTDPGHYQALQHFITHAAWDVAPVWRRLLEQLPTHRGVLIIDDKASLAQPLGHELGNDGVVFGNENPHDPESTAWPCARQRTR